MRFQQSVQNSLELWISSPQREQKWFPLSRAVMARWRHPATFINHSPRRSCGNTHAWRPCLRYTLQVHTHAHIAWGVDRSKCFMQDVDAVRTYFCSFKWLRLRSHPACDTQLGTSVVCRPLQAFWSAHRWLQWAFVNAHRVNKATRHTQQMLHKWGFKKLHILHLVWVTKRGRIQGCSYAFEYHLINVSAEFGMVKCRHVGRPLCFTSKKNQVSSAAGHIPSVDINMKHKS